MLDVACGTGDMIRTFAAGETPPARIVGVDFSANMLALGEYAGVTTPVHHDAQAVRAFDFGEFAKQLWRAQLVWLVQVASVLKLKVPAETLFRGE